jgi:hypothetical protein
MSQTVATTLLFLSITGTIFFGIKPLFYAFGRMKRVGALTLLFTAISVASLVLSILSLAR